MGNFNRGGGDRFSGKKRFDNERGFRKGERSERPAMHSAVCADCGKDCEVPFRPTGDKPVFCSNCFGKKEDSGNNRFERRSSDRPSFGDKKMFQAVCDKCHRDCEVPFRPTGDKPVFCSDCFTKGEKSASHSSVTGFDQNKKQFELLNSKLDAILKILSPQALIEKKVKAEKPAIKPKESFSKKKNQVKKVVIAKKVSTPKKASKKATAKKRK